MSHTTLWGNRSIPTTFPTPTPTARPIPAGSDPLNAYGLRIVEAAMERYHATYCFQDPTREDILAKWRADLSEGKFIPEIESILTHMKTHRFMKLWTCPVQGKACEGCVFCWGHSHMCGCDECEVDGTFTDEALAIWRIWASYVCRAPDGPVETDSEPEFTVCGACVQAKYFGKIRQEAELRGQLNEAFDFASVHMLGGESNMSVEPFREHLVAPEPEPESDNNDNNDDEGNNAALNAMAAAGLITRLTPNEIHAVLGQDTDEQTRSNAHAGITARMAAAAAAAAAHAHASAPVPFGPVLPPAMQAERDAENEAFAAGFGLGIAAVGDANPALAQARDAFFASLRHGPVDMIPTLRRTFTSASEEELLRLEQFVRAQFAAYDERTAPARAVAAAAAAAAAAPVAGEQPVFGSADDLASVIFGQDSPETAVQTHFRDWVATTLMGAGEEEFQRIVDQMVPGVNESERVIVELLLRGEVERMGMEMQM